jgi:hypothetical protein
MRIAGAPVWSKARGSYPSISGLAVTDENGRLIVEWKKGVWESPDPRPICSILQPVVNEIRSGIDTPNVYWLEGWTRVVIDIPPIKVANDGG